MFYVNCFLCISDIVYYLCLVGGLERGFYDVPYIWNVIIPTDELICQRGGSTTNQISYIIKSQYSVNNF